MVVSRDMNISATTICQKLRIVAQQLQKLEMHSKPNSATDCGHYRLLRSIVEMIRMWRIEPKFPNCFNDTTKSVNHGNRCFVRLFAQRIPTNNLRRLLALHNLLWHNSAWDLQKQFQIKRDLTEREISETTEIHIVVLIREKAFAWQRW